MILLIDFFQYNVSQAIIVTLYCKPGAFPVFHCSGTTVELLQRETP